MASGRGYLGKISAVVSANTGNYVRGLNDSAKKTQAFANSITQDLRRASADVSKSISSILTPIQRYERAIQNAASQKLAFRGFQGAIKSVEDLNARVRELVALGRQAEVDLVVRESGLRNITELRNVLGTLTQQDVDLAVNVGGVDGLRRLRADVQEVDGKVINVKTRIEASALDRLIDTFSRISPERLKRLQVRVETRELERAIIQSDRLVSITNELGNPLGAAVARYASLSAEIQTAFGPALQRAQRGVENLTTAAERGADISTQRYAGVRRAVEAVTASIERLSAVQNLANSGFTGRELEFAAPSVRDELTRSSQLSQRAAALPPAVLEDGSVRQRVEELARLRQEIARYQASVERRTTLGLDTTEAQARLSSVVSQSELARASLEDLIRAAGASGSREANEIAAIQNRARAEREFYEESRRLQAVAAADAAAPLIARARAEREFYEESRRLQAVAAADAAAPLIARARAEREFYEESRRLQAVAAADSEALAQRESQVLINRERARGDFDAERTRLLDAAARDSRDQRNQDLASPILTGNRGFQVQDLRSQVDEVEQSLSRLPRSVQQQLRPQLSAARDTLLEISRSPDAFANGINAARQQVQQLEASARRLATAFDFSQSFGGAGTAGISLGLDQTELRSYESQLQVLQGVIAQVAGDARGALATSFDVVRNRINEAFEAGNIAGARAEIDAMIRSLAAASSAAAGVRLGDVESRIQRAGDIGRRGLDRFSLAAQQAGFAIDDFFSVTGSFDQRLRAISNNVTQLAFILGGTSGLFIGLGAVIAGQAVVALTKWINSGRTAQDSTKALNDTLARQKSLVETLAESFRELGDALRSGTLSDQAAEAREFTKSIERAAKARREINQERVLENDPLIRVERANQARINREIEDSSDAGQRTGLQAQLEESRRRERLRRGALLLPPPGDREVEATIRRRAPNPFRRNVPDLPAGQDIGSIRARREALEAPLARLREILAEGPSFFDGGLRFRTAAQSFDELNSLAARLDAAISGAVDEAAGEIALSARGPAAAIRSAQEEVAAAIESGVPGAREFAVLLDQVGGEFQDAVERLNAAVQIENPAEREAAIRSAREDVNRTRARRGEIEERSDRLRRERTLNPERQIEAVIGRTQEAIDRVGSAAGVQQQRLRELQFQRETVRQQLQATPADPILIRTEQELNNSIRSLEAEVAALDETMNSFEAREARRLIGDPERGRQLSMTPEQRAAEETRQGINDIIARFGDVAAETTGLVDNAGRNAAIERFIADRARQVAPMTAGFADEVRNALLQGPSRAALGATDASTVEGQRELNRLLRGDDSNRDVDLVRLQEEANALLKQIAEKEAAPVAR